MRTFIHDDELDDDKDLDDDEDLDDDDDALIASDIPARKQWINFK